MDKRKPLISIVTPSLNQATFIRETIESVARQDYEHVEHIVMDGGSTDGTLEILKEYRHLKVVSEPDRGQADAINKGFGLAKGDILAYLNADDTLLPGALKIVADKLDPEKGPYIVMGRCMFTDESGRHVGIEHPSEFEGHLRVLQIWKGHTIPQPAVFWARKVWEDCGPVDENLSCSWIDYDLFCRFSRKYNFHLVDALIATYRLHPASKTCKAGERDILKDSIDVSKRYWGSPSLPKYWYLACSLAKFKFNRRIRARNWMRKAGDSYRKGRILSFLWHGAGGLSLAPEVAFNVYAYPRLRGRGGALARMMIRPFRSRAKNNPQTNVFLRRTGPWDDGWVGPKLAMTISVKERAEILELLGFVNLDYLGKSLKLTVFIDGKKQGNHEIVSSGNFHRALKLKEPLGGGCHLVEITASKWYIPNNYLANKDFRPLAWQFHRLDFK